MLSRHHRTKANAAKLSGYRNTRRTLPHRAIATTLGGHPYACGHRHARVDATASEGHCHAKANATTLGGYHAAVLARDSHTKILSYQACTPAGSEPGQARTSQGTQPPAAVVPLTLPLFSPSDTTNGLELLAAAVTENTGNYTAGTTTALLLSRPGPFNPAASLSPKVAKRILDLEFVEMLEVTVDDIAALVPGRPTPPARLHITDISQWIERYFLMAAVLCSKFPDKAELFAYQAIIVRAERNYEGKRWVAYDRQYRWEALARKDLNWSATDPRLYSEAFTGRARSIARCNYCLQDDHTAAQCPRNPNPPVFGWFPNPIPWPTRLIGSGLPNPDHVQDAQICRRFNEGRCQSSRCRYRHLCTWCRGDHPLISCPRQAGAGRSRCPVRPAGRAPPLFMASKRPPRP